MLEEDLDDLDDILPQFSQPSTSAKPSHPPPSSTDDPEEPELDADFLAELSKNMENLFAHNATGDQGDMKAFLQAMMQDSGEGVSEEEVSQAMKELDATLGNAKGKGKEGDFQDAIKRSMDKMNASDASARVSLLALIASVHPESVVLQAEMNSSTSADPLTALLSNLGNGLEDNPNLQSALDEMMGQLMSKELLYEPIKELNDKVPLPLPSVLPSLQCISSLIISLLMDQHYRKRI